MPASPDASRSGLGVVTRGTLLLFTATLVLVGANFASRVLLVRGLSIPDWNAFSYAVAIVSVVATIGGLGLPNTVARNLPYAASDEERRSIVRVALVVGGLSCVAIPIAMYFAGPTIGAALGASDVGFGVQILGIAYGFYAASGLVVALFQGYEDVRPNAIFVQILAPSLFVAFLLVAFLVPPGTIDFPAALWAYTAANGVAFALALGYTFGKLPQRLPRGPRAPDRTIPTLAFALPLLGVAVFAYLNGWADTLVLGAYDFPEVGTYSASLTLARLLPIGVTALAFILLPVTARLLRTGDTSAARTTFATATKWTTVFSLPLFLLFVFLPSSSLGFVYGSNYAQITTPLQIAVVGSFLATIVGPAAAVQVAFARTRLLFLNALVSAGADIAISLALVPTYGMTGAAIAWAVAAVIYPALAVAELAAMDTVHPFRRSYVVPLLASAVPLAILLRLVPGTLPGWTLVPLAAGLGLFYVLMIVLTRSVDDGDRMLLDVVERLLGRRLGLVRRLGGWAVRGTP